LDWRIGAISLAPTIRYTRWARDPAWTIPSKPDQLEALLVLSGDTMSDRHPFGSRVRFGVAGGFPLVRPVRSETWGRTAPELLSYSASREYFRGWIVGPRFEFHLSESIGLVAEANYRQLRFSGTDVYVILNPVTGVPETRTITTEGKAAVLWQFPVLLRARLSTGAINPFFDLGPSFRLPQDVGGNAATIGVSGGAGIRPSWRGVAFETGLRYSYWGPTKRRNGDIAPNDFRRNQLDLTFAVTF
jgi:hypothetical protein